VRDKIKIVIIPSCNNNFITRVLQEKKTSDYCVRIIVKAARKPIKSTQTGLGEKKEFQTKKKTKTKRGRRQPLNPSTSW